MSWTRVKIIKDQFGEDEVGRAKAKMVYYAESDTFVAADAALSADDGTTSVPGRDAIYSDDRPRCKVVGRDVERKSPTKFYVTVDLEDRTDGTPTEDLLTKPALIDTSYQTEDEEYTKDAEGTAVVNAAGEPPDQFPTRQRSIKVYTIKKYVDASARTAIEAVRETNNPASVTIDGNTHAEDEAFLSDCSFDEVDDGIYEATIVIKIKKDGWTDIMLNVGYDELVGGVRVPILVESDDDPPKKIPAAKAWPLNSDGTKKSSASAEPEELAPYYPYPQASSWSGVPLT